MKASNILAAVLLLAMVSAALADNFGPVGNQFNIDFVTISGSTNPHENLPLSGGYGVVANDYRIGKFEVTDAQWDKFKAAYGTVTGSPSSAYDQSSYFTGANVPTNHVSWYEAAQFVNWLNTSTGHQPAYKFTGTQGTSGYTFATWSNSEADNGTNLYRHKDAFYYLPTEDEWCKAAYSNGTSIQEYATKAGESLAQGNGISGTGWNYYNNGHATNPEGPWNVGSGSQELNGTYDMMGNIWEWMESPYIWNNYGAGSERGLRGGSYDHGSASLGASLRGAGSNYSLPPSDDRDILGFRIASDVPEPASLSLLALGGLAVIRRRRQR